MAQALEDAGCEGRVISFEINLENAEIARQNLTAAGLVERVELHVGDSRTLLPRALEKIGGIRAAFLDASHLNDDVMEEFECLFPKLTKDALVMFDNTYQIAEAGEDPRVNGALKRISAEYGGNLINLEHVSWYTPGLALWQRVPNL